MLSEELFVEFGLIFGDAYYGGFYANPQVVAFLRAVMYIVLTNSTASVLTGRGGSFVILSRHNG